MYPLYTLRPDGSLGVVPVVDMGGFWDRLVLCWVLQRVRWVEEQLLHGHQVRGATDAYGDARVLIGERAIVLHYVHGILDSLPK